MAVCFPVNLAESVLSRFTSSTCSRTEPLVTSGTSGWMPFLSPNQDYQSTVRNRKHWLQPVAWPCPFFVHHRTPVSPTAVSRCGVPWLQYFCPVWRSLSGRSL